MLDYNMELIVLLETHSHHKKSMIRIVIWNVQKINQFNVEEDGEIVFMKWSKVLQKPKLKKLSRKQKPPKKSKLRLKKNPKRRNTLDALLIQNIEPYQHTSLRVESGHLKNVSD